MTDVGTQVLIAPLILSAAILILMLQIAFRRQTFVTWVLTCLSLVTAMLVITPILTNGPASLSVMNTPLLVIDQFSLFFSILILFATLITALLARDYLEYRSGENEEFYLLLLLSSLGGLILVSATHLASFLLGLELLGVALYALIAYPERGHFPLEAATKYLILSGAASAILLFGFALIYAALGTMSFTGIGEQLQQLIDDARRLMILAGTGLVFTGIGFKLSLFPFHMWTPDVYQGAPSPVTGFLATVSKGAIFAALLRFFIDAELYQYSGLMTGLSAVAIGSMLAGNLLALMQTDLKRLLAYSSIAHLGYLCIILVVCGASQNPAMAVEAVGFYIAAYIITSLAAFAMLSIISTLGEASTVTDVTGLFWRHPLLALIFTVAMLSLAGIPLTAGFIAKFYIFTAGIEASLWLLLSVLVIGSGIGIYYYLRVVYAMTLREEGPAEDARPGISPLAKSVVWLLIFMVLYFGVLPQSVMQYLSSVAL